MKKYFIVILSLAVCIAILIECWVAYVADSINPNDYRLQITQIVNEKFQRTLKLDDDFKLTLFPSVGIELGSASLSEFKSNKEFASIEGVRVSLALLPLLSREVVVDRIAFNGFKATLVKRKNGKTNFADFLAQFASPAEVVAEKGGAVQAVKFDIVAVRFKKSEFIYRDDTTGVQYAVKNLNLKTGRIASGAPSKVFLDAQIQANRPKLDIATQLNATLTLDSSKQLYKVEGLDLHVDGAGLNIENLLIQASGDAVMDLAKQEFSARKLLFLASGSYGSAPSLFGTASGLFDPVSALYGSTSGSYGKDNFEIKLKAPALNLTQDNIASERCTLNAKLNGERGNISAWISLLGAEGNTQFFKGSMLNLELIMQRQPQLEHISSEKNSYFRLARYPEKTVERDSDRVSTLKSDQPATIIKLKLSSPFAGNFDSGQFNLPELVVSASTYGEKMPNKPINGELKGNVLIDADRQSLQANLEGRLLQSQLASKMVLNNFSNPIIRFDLDVDQFDADQYLRKKIEKPDAALPTLPDVSEQPINLSVLRELNAEGNLRIGALKLGNVKSSQVHLDVKAHKGLFSINPFSANLYHGSMSGNVMLNATQMIPSFTLNEKLEGINVFPLLSDAFDFGIVEGKGSATLNLKMQGNSFSALKKSLNGDISLDFAEGYVKGINVAKDLNDAANKVGIKSQSHLANIDERTSYDQMTAHFKLNNGIAHNGDLLLKSPLLQMTGNGSVNFEKDSLNYHTKATLVSEQGDKHNSGNFTVPVRVSGPFTDLKYTLDFGEKVHDPHNKNKVKAKPKTKVKSKIKSKVKAPKK